MREGPGYIKSWATQALDPLTVGHMCVCGLYAFAFLVSWSWLDCAARFNFGFPQGLQVALFSVFH